MNKYDLERKITKEFINEASDREGSYTRSLKRAASSAAKAFIPSYGPLGLDAADAAREAGDAYDYSRVKGKMNKEDKRIYEDVKSLEGLVSSLQELMRPESMDKYFEEHGENFAIAIINEALENNRLKGDTYELSYRGQGSMTRMLPKLNQS
tara:strand:- start:88 stop:543 length:456 start_codon:yes stop_codon:yes gene_type:complete